MPENVATITSELISVSARLEIATGEYAKACKDAAEKRSDYDIAKAKSIIKSKLKTAGDRAAEATIACEA